MSFDTCLLLILVTIVIYVFTQRREEFASRDEKAAAVRSWFQRNPEPTYTRYKQDFAGKSNVVEYEDALKLYQDGKFSVNAIRNVI